MSVTLVAILVLVGTTFLLDLWLNLGPVLPLALYGLFIVAAAYSLSPPAVVVVAVWATALEGLDTGLMGHDPPMAAVHGLSLALLGALGTTLSVRLRHEAALSAQREALAEERERALCTLRTLIDTLPAGVLVADADGATVLANQAARLLLADPTRAGDEGWPGMHPPAFPPFSQKDPLVGCRALS